MGLNLFFSLTKTLLLGLLFSHLLNHNIFRIVWINIVSFHLLLWNLLILKLMLRYIRYVWYFDLVLVRLLLNSQIFIWFLWLWDRKVGRYVLISLWGGYWLRFFLIVWILLICYLLFRFFWTLLILIFHFWRRLLRPRIFHLLLYIAILSWKTGFISSWCLWFLRLVFKLRHSGWKFDFFVFCMVLLINGSSFGWH